MLANFGLPGTINFVGEFMILLAIFKINFLITLFLFFGLVITLAYSLYLYNRVAHGFIKTIFIRYYSDLTRKDLFLLILFILLIY
jgi:NADH-quinone oxidoreductase subunit M